MLERTSIYRAKQRISVLHGRNRYPLILLRITPSRSNPLAKRTHTRRVVVLVVADRHDEHRPPGTQDLGDSIRSPRGG